MKRSNAFVTCLALVAVATLLASPLLAQSEKSDAKASPTAFLIISPHTMEQCLAALDEVLAQPEGEAQLAMWDWGCMAGDHTGYLMTTAMNAEAALNMVPKGVRAQAKAMPLGKITSEQIAAYHEKMK